ncbi:helix-turn-helix transcriptional regulator [uncultured Draconibacterium sp.]|uniref:helix-turn-helix domain-containing protein n=1 Tax=uncultured Draconibacterium sp. TaxID=1573823 RepID=UPI0029C8F6AC|nr:helix-turn-helix transcriptional regulator [uncultured Draconibacterium sp.]
MKHTMNTIKLRSDYLKDVVSVLVSQRHKVGISQEELNARLGVSDRLVSKWECGMRSPTSFNLYCWAYALGMKLTVTADKTIPPYGRPEHKGRAANDNRFGIVN